MLIEWLSWTFLHLIEIILVENKFSYNVSWPFTSQWQILDYTCFIWRWIFDQDYDWQDFEILAFDISVLSILYAY